MNITVITTGTELLRGATVNTNLAGIGERLLAVGTGISRCLAVGDDAGELAGAFRFALAAGSDAVIVSGGLGPTEDDLTRDVAADFFGRPLAADPRLRRHLEEWWESRHPERGAPPAGYWRQAEVPQGARALDNPNGSAPGLAFEHGKAAVFLLPGPPPELFPILDTEVVPAIARRFREGEHKLTRAMLVAGTPELEVQEHARSDTAGLPLELSYCANAEGTRLFLAGESEEDLDEAERRIRADFGDRIPAGRALDLLPDLIVLLEKAQLSVGFAESCTGGMMAAAMTDYPGVSAVFKGGIVCYANAVKERLLGVPSGLLEREGAVSAACVEAMLDGVRQALGVDCAVAVSGVAGPDGGSEAKPVGTVFIGASAPRTGRVVERCFFRGDRATVRRRAVAAGWNMLRNLLLRELKIS